MQKFFRKITKYFKQCIAQISVKLRNILNSVPKMTLYYFHRQMYTHPGVGAELPPQTPSEPPHESPSWRPLETPPEAPPETPPGLRPQTGQLAAGSCDLNKTDNLYSMISREH